MKKISFLLLCLAVLFFVGCQPEPPQPVLHVSCDSLVFHGEETRQVLITAEGLTNTFTFTLLGPDWIESNPSHGSIGNEDTVVVNITSHLDHALFCLEGALKVEYNIGCHKIALKGFPEEFMDYSMPDTLFFYSGCDPMPLCIANTGNVPISYSITSSSEAVSVLQTEGQIGVESQVEIPINILWNQAVAESDPYLYVTLNENVVDTVAVVVERKLMLSSEVIDAEYSKATDLLVFVTADGTLNIYHPSLRTFDVVPLSYYPRCVSISSDGTKAAVGHDGYVSYVDLQSSSLVHTHSIGCSAFDIALGDNGWAYIIPSRDQWVQLHCIHVAIPNATDILADGLVYAGSRTKAHPSGNSLYVASNGLSPSYIDKYSMQQGAAEFMFSWPYHGNYPAGGDLWCSEEGSRVFTKAGTVIRASDMSYCGELRFEGGSNYFNNIVWLEHLESAKHLYILSGSRDWYYNPHMPFVYVHHSDNYTFEDKIRLEDYHAFDSEGNMTAYTPEPYFVFANSNGHELYVITKALGTESVEWAVELIICE